MTRVQCAYRCEQVARRPLSRRCLYTAAMIRFTMAALILLSVGVGFAGCSGGGSSGKTASPLATTRATSASAPSGVSPVPDAIRRLELSGIADVESLKRSAGAGEIERDLVLYADLTGDAVEEAVVPISTGGTQGVIAFIVLTPAGGTTRTLLTQEPRPGGGIRLEIAGGKLQETRAVPGPDDPECCPSILRVTTYDWNGSALIASSTDEFTNPAAGAKGTATAVIR